MLGTLRVVLALKPAIDIQISRRLRWDSIPVEEVGHDHKEAVGGKFVSNQLGIDQAITEDVRETF